MKKIVLINCYFGKYPKYMDMFLKSCVDNPAVDFLFFTDNDMDFVASNIKFVKKTFQEIKGIIQEHFDFKISLEMPYKLCDYKPVYGYVFQEYIEGYDYWGYCDIDLVFGDIRKFLDKVMMDDYDKIYQLGHLTVYKNTEDVNTAFLQDKAEEYKKAFTTEIIAVYDEVYGIQKVFSELGKKVYISRDYADITKMRYRFTLSDFQVPKENNNYPDQVFVRENGRIYRYYVSEDGSLKKEEFIYIHFQKRKMEHKCSPNVDYFVTYDGFFEMTEPVTKDHINQYNRYIRSKEIRNSIEHFIWRVKRKLDKIKKGEKL